MIGLLLVDSLYYGLARLLLPLLPPAAAWLWSILLFGGRPAAIEIAGGAATLAGVLLVTASRAGVFDMPRGAG